MSWFLRILVFVWIGFDSVALIGQDQILFDSEDAEAEFDVAINPADSNNIIVATMRGFDDVTNSFLSIYYSNDFGQSWQKSSFSGRHDGETGSGDPVLAFDDEGNAFLVNLTISDDFDVYTILSKSTDGGATWTLLADYREFTDKPWIEIDRSATSPFKGNIYLPVVEEDLVLLSFDPDGSLISRSQIDDGEQIPSVVVGKGGDVFTSCITLADPMDIYFQHWTNEGKDLVSQRSVAQFPDYTFEAPDISTRFQPAPYLAIDLSEGPFAGRIYLAYTASEPSGEDFFNVFLTYSDDQGVTWSPAKIVHEDTRDNVQQFYSSIFVNDNGVLILDWYDRGNYEPFDSKTDFFMGISYDGGESFKEVKLNSKSMDFDVTSQAGFGFGVGEYHQCIATSSTAISFWSDGRTNDGDLNLYFAKVDLQDPISGVTELGLINSDIKLSTIYPLPADQIAYVDLDLKKAFELNYQIIGLNGQVLFTSPFEKFAPGKHKMSIRTDLPSGLYTLGISSSKGYFKHQKMLIR